MDWDAIVAIVEIVGLLAVVASLVYLAIQVRQNSQLISQNTVVARSAMVHETSAFYARFFELIADNSELASIFHRGKTSEDLGPVELERLKRSWRFISRASKIWTISSSRTCILMRMTTKT